jgi:acylphosphatase
VQEATRIGVSGDVTNRADGTVLAHVEGAAEDVDRLVAWFRAGGAPSARVDSVEMTDEPTVGASSFDIV